ncbi:MAG: hypothetical protein IRZ09_07230 [Variibacter sp.]|nr:hypothetical protein [Variibacter sp.]
MAHYAHRAAALLFAAAVGTTAPASAASFFEKNFWLSGPRYEARLPACDDPGLLQTISSRFAQKEAGFWNSALQIVDFLRIREVAFRPWAVDTIPRRFCTGKVLTSDGIERRVNYSVIEDGGLIGAGWGVEWCVVGLDRNWAYNPACRMALP